MASPKNPFPNEKKQRPTHLSLQDIFSQHDDAPAADKLSKAESRAKSAETELLSTPEGPLPETCASGGDEFKIQELLMFSSQQNVTPTLISPKNAELLISTSSKMISTETTSNGSSSGAKIVYWANLMAAKIGHNN